ncbi:hypothetical protein GPL21_20265 [Bradyrhizobium pachyrhizi]|uniref:Uncharacterized protein n=1 Tax=Bradyrhizobium pachyrhizi TaxID=280333 RepID=A0A844SYG6_9BRAD|nr:MULTISPECIES: hypothetical protein [Bradyrhizobium]MVT67440.1 hypothetical protein [Bradyrhizobium pachyrhizi]WFU54307.1 hypothetical protein QA639_32385 [Bradyrhizobium pachyrhizi]WOH79990.1 hypothetical protein RX327_29735 [Bradyrhizobium sp. BEA-2-5]
MSGSAVIRGAKGTKGALPCFFSRGRWEAVAMTLIGGGIFMLVQPFSIDLYSYSFVTILAGTVGFVVVSHFPE